MSKVTVTSSGTNCSGSGSEARMLFPRQLSKFTRAAWAGHTAHTTSNSDVRRDMLRVIMPDRCRCLRGASWHRPLSEQAVPTPGMDKSDRG